ncbi:MAG: hypothetical protein U9Q38_06885, partial [Thermodesulfobacteriota bacterium]|nr:hypothetical protein [Thermodesulfobacteriota bacterium]
MMRKVTIQCGVLLIMLIQVSILPILGLNEVNGISSYSSNTINVDQSGSGDYTTIDDAINASNPSDTIFIKNGIYKGNYYINK